jgi:hypothetical protein
VCRHVAVAVTTKEERASPGPFPGVQGFRESAHHPLRRVKVEQPNVNVLGQSADLAGFRRKAHALPPSHNYNLAVYRFAVVPPQAHAPIKLDGDAPIDAESPHATRHPLHARRESARPAFTLIGAPFTEGFRDLASESG